MTTLLELLQEFCDRRGLESPGAVMSTVDGTIKQLRGLANETVGDIVSRPRSWAVLQKEATFVTLAAELQGTIATIAPSGFKAILLDTMFDRTEQLPVFGPRDGQTWQLEKASPSNSTPYHYRLWQDKLYLQPAPPAGHTVAFEYTSDYAIKHPDGTYGKRFTDDEDIILFDDDELFLLGLKWRWLKTQGLGFKQDFDDFEYRLTNSLGRQTSAPSINLAGSEQSARPGVLVPSGNWPL